MLTFANFITEEKKSHYGFLRPGGKDIKVSDKGTHDKLAPKHGFRDREHAIDSGLVRYKHQHESIPYHGKINNAGYEYHNTHTNRKAIAKHLSKTRFGGDVWLDSIHPKTKKMASKGFKSTEDAIKHLESSNDDD